MNHEQYWSAAPKSCYLGVLDYINLQAALIAIRGRIFVSKEPHEVIENGKRIFQVLADEWANLHVINRYAKYLVK